VSEFPSYDTDSPMRVGDIAGLATKYQRPLPRWSGIVCTFAESEVEARGWLNELYSPLCIGVASPMNNRLDKKIGV
jgi:hypothetical protein